jgi:hypothetical protein
MGAELNSENSSPPQETGGLSQVRETSVARPMGSEAATPEHAADAASGEGSLATGARDEGQAKAIIAQVPEPSVEAEKNSPAGKTGRDHEIGDSSVAVASFDGAAVDPFREALAGRRQSNGIHRTATRPLVTDALRGEGAPLRQRNRASLLVNLPGDEMPLLIEMIMDLGVN